MDFDNVGLLAGDPQQPVQRILTCLDVTPDVVEEAIAKDVQLIVAHHPVIFPKLTRIVENEPSGAMLRKLIRHDIGVYAAHTNLDAAAHGVSQSMAAQLDLTDVQGLDYSYNTTRLVILRIPAAIKQEVQTLLSGLDLHCYWANEELNTMAGRFTCDKHKLSKVEQALQTGIEGAPISIDHVPVETPSPLYAFGALGSLAEPLSMQDFLAHVHHKLGADALRYAGGSKEHKISRVAVCGGSGSFLIKAALKARADAFVTADIKYHDYFVPSPFLLIDAGHYESEASAISLLARELGQAFPEISVSATEVNTNPMKAFNSFYS